MSADGFDREALEIIVPRRATLRAYAIQQLCAQGLPYTEVTADDVLRAALYEQVSAVQEQRYTATTAPKKAPEKDFQTLAHDLGFVTMVQEQQLYRFWKVGTFHPSFGKPTGDRGRNAAAMARVKAQFAAVLASTPYKTKWAEGFVQRHLMRDPADAPHIAHVLSTTAIVAASQACDLACAWCAWGDVGLLTASSYPYASALLRVARECQTLSQDADDPRDLAAHVRADVVALLRTLDGYQLTEAGAIRQERHIVLTDESILHQPPGSPARRRFQEQITPVRAAYVAALAQNRPCTEDQASILLDILLQHGLPGLIGWRHQEQDLPDADYLWDHLHKRARAMIDWMPETEQAVVIERLRACVEANRQCQAGISFRRLIEDGPSSRYRRRLQHRKPPDAFFQQIAQRWGMPTRTAYGLFRNLVVSGLIGLIPKQQWGSLVHQEIWNYLWMLKIGRVEDTVSMAALTAQVNHETQARNLPQLPKHIITTLFQHFPKDHYYNSGNIPRLVGIPQRRALKLRGVDRLHEHWLVIPLELPIQLVDPSQHPAGATCTALMVIDQGGATPVDLWVTDQALTASDIGLSLYAAIFHPATRHWPLRGIPEHIHVPSPFHEAPALQRAAHLLLAGLHPLTALETYLCDFPAIRQIIHALQQYYQPPLVAGRYRAPPPHATILQATQDIRTWVAATCFDAHQVKQAPPRFRTHGVDLPGHTTAAAGWLLPTVGQTTTIRNGVAWERRTYGASDAAIEPGEPVSIRMQPALWGRARGLFIERADAVRYLPLIRHKEHGYE